MASTSVPLLLDRVEGRQSIVLLTLEITWNLMLIIVSVTMLFSTREEHPTTPLRLWICLYTIQCLFDVIGFISFRNNIKLCKFISFVWWIFGVYWVAVGGYLLMHNAPRLYWFVVALLTLQVLTAVLPLIISILRSNKEVVAESDHSVDVEKLADRRHAPLPQYMLNNYSQLTQTCNNAYLSVPRRDHSSSLVSSTSVSGRDHSSSLAPSTSVSRRDHSSSLAPSTSVSVRDQSSSLIPSTSISGRDCSSSLAPSTYVSGRDSSSSLAPSTYVSGRDRSSSLAPSTSVSVRGHSSSLVLSTVISGRDRSSSLGPPTTVSKTDHSSSLAPSTSVSRRDHSSSVIPSTSVSLINNSSSLIPSTPVLSSRSSTNKNNLCDKKSNNPIYEIPDNIVRLIKQDIVPEVLKKPVSSSTYKDFFASLLYAEDYYIEKWSKFCLSNVTLKLHDAKSYCKLNKAKSLRDDKLSKVKSLRDDKPLVAFVIDSIPERRPFLLSRDFVFVRPSGKNMEPFQGILYRVVRSTLVLVEFKKDFHSQHHPHREYDVSFSFNRVCLKRCHKAIETVATNSSLHNFLFPKPMTRSNSALPSYLVAKAFRYRLRGAPPYLIEGPQATTSGKLSPTGELIRDLSPTGELIRDIVFAILDDSQKSRILVCTPLNDTCDVLTRSLRLKIPESDIFRANAAFREFDDVPDDILSSSSYDRECFTCPALEDLGNFKVIISTFISSFRLNSKGLSSGHFTHIIMVDASSATEPETMVTLANFASEETGILVTGTERNFPGWVRSEIGRKYGLQKSYFKRLFEM